MKLKHILLALFVVLLCVVTINTANKAEAVTAGTLSVELGDYNESTGVHYIKFTLTGGGTVNYLWITGETSSYSNYYPINANSSITWTPSQAGEYYAIVNCTDGSGAANSNRVDFHVGRPTGVTMKVNGTTSGQKFAVNATIPFTFTSDNPNDNGFIYVYKADGTEYKHWNIYTTRSSSTTISDPGNYTAIVQLWNSTHWTKSASVSFTVYGGSLSVTSFADTSSSNGKTVQGTIKYTISIKNNANCKVNLNFAVTYANGKNLYSVSNGTATNGTGTTASVTGNLKELAAGGTVTIVLSVNTNDSGFTNTTYTVNLGTVSGAMVGLSSGSGSVSGSTTTSYTFKPARGSVSLSWSSSVTGGSFVRGTYTYTVTFKNSTNHTITGIDYTIKIGSTKIVTVTDGTAKAEQSYVKVGDNKTEVSLGNVSGNDGTVSLLVTIDTTGMAGNASYTFTLAGGTCTSTGVVSNYNLDAGQSTTHSINVPGGTVTTTVTGQPTTNGKIVYGNISYTIKIHNGTNYDIKNISFKFGNSSVNILTVTNGVVQSSGYVTSANGVANTLNAGADMNITFTFNTANLGSQDLYTFKVLNSSSTNSTTFVGSSLSPTFDSATHNYYVANGTLDVAISQNNPGTNGATIADKAVVKGQVVYTVTITNNTNHNVNNVSFVVKIGSSNLITVTNGSITGTSHGCYVSSTGLGSNFTINAGAEKVITITVNTDSSSLSRNTNYAVSTVTGNASASNLTLGTKTATINAGSGNSIKTSKTDVSISWTPSIESNNVVEGRYTYDVTFTNNSNYAISGVNFTIGYGTNTIVSVNGTSLNYSGCAVNATSNGLANPLGAGASITLQVTIDVSSLTDDEDYTFVLAAGNVTPNGIQGGAKDTAFAPNGSGSHTITVRSGDISVTLESESVIGGGSPVTLVGSGVAEDKVIYTLTFTNGTNHGLKNLTIALKNGSTTLLLVDKNGISIKSDLIDSADFQTGSKDSLASLTSGGTIVIEVCLDATDPSLDAAGRFSVTLEGNASSSGVLGSGGDAANLTFNADPRNHTFMVRHNVNLLVQSGLSTSIPASAIFAAMDKTTAYGPEKANGLAGNSITNLVITDFNGTQTALSGITASGTNLTVNLSANCNTAIVQVTYGSGETVLVPFQVTVLSAGDDKTFVLKYSLPVSAAVSEILSGMSFTGGAYTSTTYTATGVSTDYHGEAAAQVTGSFGTFDFADDTLTYSNTSIMNAGDSLYLVIRVSEGEGTENVDYVDLYKKITMIPANSIYYEDNNGSIQYPNVNDIETLGGLNGGSTSIVLPVLPGTNSFDDGSYKQTGDVEFSGLGCQKVPVHANQVTIRFSFTGTGFELLSRVNAFDAATILVKVSPAGADTWTTYPVITRFDPNGNGNAEVYQVPVFRLNETTYGDYDVQIVGLPMQDYDQNGQPIAGSQQTSYIYVDGIRIYNSLGDDELTENYGEEKDAGFTNLRDLILDGLGMITVTEDSKTSGFTTGNFFYTPDDNQNLSAALGGINELGAIGANNEILLNKAAGDYMIVLKVKGDGLLQIGIRDVYDAKFAGLDGDNDSTTVSVRTTGGWEFLAPEIYHGTEQYYNVDLSSCPVDGEYKLVMLKVHSGFASFTNVKHNGVEFGAIGEAALDAYVEPGYYFNQSGDLCKLEDGEEVIVKENALAELNVIDSLLQDEAE